MSFFICIGKRSKLVHNGKDFDLVETFDLISDTEYSSSLSDEYMGSGDEDMDIETLASIPHENAPGLTTTFSTITQVEPIEQGVNLANWIRVNEEITVTPIHQCYLDP